MERKSKQVIVMRNSFIVDGKKITPRKGKYIAQGAHASMKAILDNMNDLPDNGKMILYYKYNSALEDWIKNAFTKVTCVVETEEEIIALYEKAQQKGMLCSLIKDAGLTEFGGVPTITCCAIGPAWSDEVDEITGGLKLF